MRPDVESLFDTASPSSDEAQTAAQKEKETVSNINSALELIRVRLIPTRAYLFHLVIETRASKRFQDVES